VRALAVLFVVTLVAPAERARADTPPASRWVGAAVVPERRVDVAVVHELRLSRFRYWPDEIGIAWADGVDVAVGVSPRLTLGLSHSARARGTVDHGGGWCHELRGHPCDAAYAGALVDARWLVSANRRRQLAALARAGVMGLAPARPVVRLGVSSRHGRGPLWGVVEPEVQIALGNRAYGSRDQLVAPLWLGVGRRRAAAWVMSGVRGELVGFREKLEIPFMLGAGVTYGRARIGVEAGWPQLAGPQNTGNIRHAALWIAGTY
jgi:hypothetical protein